MRTERLDKFILRDYSCCMNIIRRTLDIDTDARLREMADERGQDVAAVLAEAVALRRLDDFRKTRAAVPLDEEGLGRELGSAKELPRRRRAGSDDP